MPEECPPDDVLVPSEHPFYRLAKQSDTYNVDDFKSYAEADPSRNWGALLPLAVGLSIIDNEKKARKQLKLPMFRQFKGIIALILNPTDGSQSNRFTPIPLYMVAHDFFPNVKPKHDAGMRRLTLINTLEFYDIPQILTAADATGTNYLCTLFKQADDCYVYLGGMNEIC